MNSKAPALEIDKVTVKYWGKLVLDNFSLTVNEEEIVSLLGPSGCGKTTLLKSIAGLEDIAGGEIRIFGKTVQTSSKSLPTRKRGLGMTFQDNALFPHLTVYENVIFGIPRKEQKTIPTRERIKELLHSLDLFHLSDKYPHQLSGGQQQRISLARSIAPRPKLILMDEPFNSQDVGLKEKIIDSVMGILKKEKITTLVVTHDQNEAFKISHRVGVMQEYRLEQIGSPKEIYHFPATRFIASFIGSGTFIRAHYSQRQAASNWFSFKERSLHGPPAFQDGEMVWVHLRPEDVILSGERSGKDSVSGVIISKEFRSGNYFYKIRLADPAFPNDEDPNLFSLMPTVFEKNIGDRVTVHVVDKPYNFFSDQSIYDIIIM